MLCHVIGDAYVDLLCFLAGSLPQQGEDSTLSQAVQTMAGGSTINTATHLRDLVRHQWDNNEEDDENGMIPRIAVQTMLNPNDEYGALLLRHAAQHDIQVINCCSGEEEEAAVADGASSRASAATPHCVVIVSEGDRCFMTHRGCSETFTGLDLQLDALIEYDGPVHLHVAGLYCTPGFGDGSLRQQLMKIHTERQQRWPHHRTSVSLVTQFDVHQRWDGDLDALVPFLQFLIMNEVEVNSIVNRARGGLANESSEFSLEEWMSVFAMLSLETVVIVTKGEKGAVAFRGRQVIASIGTAVDVAVVDPTGAGDAFAGGLLHGVWDWDRKNGSETALKQQWPSDEAVKHGLQWGCAVGTAAVTIRGASVPAQMELIFELYRKQQCI